ncbi:dipeptidase PepV [Peribacillus cavernae]|uniref:Dipeptidase PepV n=1 Tax=Peribacillus cavernae TaxID=1674310 RepID=A0A3S0VPB8_9BACI|nr:dipeptidase PepV [Peribacillus cavernae]MDQ0220303.1 succinyl-diaminopimelate desuccinylase [Peribacillus cavernae]RUQ31961.1 dipeptidase PepV [Peribacillus cavernae]
MTEINWQEEIENRKESLLKDTQALLRIKSVLDEENTADNAPLGIGVKAALDFMLQLGEKDGFTVKNVDNLAGHLEMGQGDELLGILCHVDVVPEGDGWSSDPYAAEIRDGKIFARGAIDDKGPTMAAYYAMKTVKELGLPLHKRIRMIIGTDEESDWRCVERYFETEEMPALGFAPDADFPIIYAEKGIWDFTIKQIDEAAHASEAELDVVEFSSGRRPNMVPDYAIARVHAKARQVEIAEQFKLFKQKHSLNGKATLEQDQVILELEGASAHGSLPDSGINAGLYLSAFLSGLDVSEQAKHYFTFVHDSLFGDSRGSKLGIAYADDISSDLTLNAGIFNYSNEKGGSVSFSMRYPVTYKWEEGKKAFEHTLKKLGFNVLSHSNSEPHHVKRDSFLIQTLQKVYEEETGTKADLLAIGGGTYARSLKEGVAFGPLFPGNEDIAHQKDEYIVIDDMLKTAAIYARAIYELAK